jgi:hypothetical protein
MPLPAAPQPVRGIPAAPRAEPTVFLSYAHAEQAIVRELWQALTSNGLSVLIDEVHLKPGQDIADFARRMIKQADATVCLVSNVSIASAWVIFEATTALQNEHDNPNARIIACAADQVFFQDGIQLRLSTAINDRLTVLKAEIVSHLEHELDITVLEQERARLRAMRDSLGGVLARLRSSLTLTLTPPDGIASAARRIADHVRDLKGQQPARSDPRDLRARAHALRNYFVADETETALGELLQFVEEFSTDRRRMNSAISYCNTLRRIARMERDNNLRFLDAEERREPTIVKVLELIDLIEADPQLPLAS